MFCYSAQVAANTNANKVLLVFTYVFGVMVPQPISVREWRAVLEENTLETGFSQLRIKITSITRSSDYFAACDAARCSGGDWRGVGVLLGASALKDVVASAQLAQFMQSSLMNVLLDVVSYEAVYAFMQVHTQHRCSRPAARRSFQLLISVLA